MKKAFITTGFTALIACFLMALTACNLFGNDSCKGNHEFGEIIPLTEPTCTENGTGKRICQKCGYEQTGFVLPKTGHSFGEAVVEAEATCVKEGKESKTCSVCGVKNEFTVEKKPHTLGEWQTEEESTCIKHGYRVKKCAFCDYRIEEALGYSAHNYEETERKEASCISAGYVNYSCSICGDTRTETSEKLNHYFPDGTKTVYDYMDSKDPNYCYKAYKTCARCKENVLQKTRSHSMMRDSENYVEATCSAKGVNAEKCRYCEYRTSEETAVNLLNHKGGAVQYGKRNAENCTVQATVSCTLCHKEIQSWTEASHEYDSDTFECTGAGCKSVKEINSLYFEYSATYLGGWAIKKINSKRIDDVKKYIDDNGGRIRLPARGSATSGTTAMDFDVEAVDSNAFDALGAEYKAKIKYIYVPSGYKYIFSDAFANLPNLEKVTFTKNVIMIENSALAGCKNVRELTLPYEHYDNLISIFGTTKSNLAGYALTTLNVYRPVNVSNVNFSSKNHVLFEKLSAVNIYTEFIGGITYNVDGLKINVSRTVLKNGINEADGSITYYLK